MPELPFISNKYPLPTQMFIQPGVDPTKGSFVYTEKVNTVVKITLYNKLHIDTRLHNRAYTLGNGWHGDHSTEYTYMYVIDIR